MRRLLAALAVVSACLPPAGPGLGPIPVDQSPCEALSWPLADTPDGPGAWLVDAARGRTLALGWDTVSGEGRAPAELSVVVGPVAVVTLIEVRGPEDSLRGPSRCAAAPRLVVDVALEVRSADRSLVASGPGQISAFMDRPDDLVMTGALTGQLDGAAVGLLLSVPRASTPDFTVAELTAGGQAIARCAGEGCVVVGASLGAKPR